MLTGPAPTPEDKHLPCCSKVSKTHQQKEVLLGALGLKIISGGTARAGRPCFGRVAENYFEEDTGMLLPPFEIIFFGNAK